MAVYKLGSSGPDVKKFQEKLNKARTKPKLVADGVFGKNTKTAVVNFQKSAGLKADGIAGKNTLAALDKGGKAAPSASTIDWPLDTDWEHDLKEHHKGRDADLENNGKYRIVFDQAPSISMRSDQDTMRQSPSSTGPRRSRSRWPRRSCG